MVGYLSRFAIAATLVATVAACNGSSSMGPSGGSGSFSWTMDGANYTATTGYIQVTAPTPGVLDITGTQFNSTTNTTTLALLLGFIPGTGTYPLGVNQGTNAGGTGTVTTTSPTGTWSTPYSGAAGTVTITSISSSQISGTFQFTAPPVPPQSGAARVISNGKFSVPANGFTVAPASAPGSFMNATIGGQSFVSATEAGQGSASSFGLQGTSTTATNAITSISILSTGSISPGSYPVTPPAGGGAYFVVTVTTGGSIFGGQGADSGSVTITSNSGGRIKGSFTGNFGGLSVTNGTFDIKLNGV